jgi:hypothetical protein
MTVMHCFKQRGVRIVIQNVKMPRIADDIILQIKCSDYVHYFSILFGDNQRNHPQNIYVLMFIMFMQYSSSLI